MSNQNSFSTEISWQHKLKDENRLEFGLAFDDNQFLVSGLYQWVYELKGDFNWYFGVGGVLEKRAARNYTLAAAGDLGIEYNFEFPLQLSFDVRPGVEVFGAFLEFRDTPLSLAARYRF